MKIGFLGAGNLGRAIIVGLLNSKKYQKEDFKIVVASKESLASLQEQNFQVSQDWNFLANCDVVILALRPDDIKSLAQKLTTSFSKVPIIISLAAGVTLSQLATIFSNAAVSRAMPNTSVQYNQSMTMIVAEGNNQANQIAQELFNLLGKTILLPEAKIHVFIAICGSASAYLYYLLQPLMQLALTSNISLADSKAIIANLLTGAAANIYHSNMTLVQLQEQVSVPGGTTIEAIKIFDQSQVQKIISTAISAVRRRSEELE